MKKTISIIVPFYNEEVSLRPFIEELIYKTNSIKSKYFVEIILLDNHSTDNSKYQAIELKRKYKLKLYRQNRNFGYQANILAGYHKSKGDAVIQIDSDGEDDPNIIHKFISKWEAGYDVVYGIRRQRKEPYILQIQRKIFYRLLTSLSDLDIPIDSGDFRLVDRKIVNQLKIFKEKSLYLRGIIAYIGGNQTGVIYDRRSRKGGVSKFSWIKYIFFALNALVSFSKRPLYLISFIGFWICLISLAVLMYYLYLYIFGYIQVKGFTTLISILIFFNIILIASLGIISIYISQILDEVRNRPSYILDNES